MIVPLEKLIHSVFVRKITQLGDFLEGECGRGGQLFDLGKLLTVYRFL